MLRLITVIIISCLSLLSCESSRNIEQKNKEIVRKAINEIINERKLNAFENYFASNVVDHGAWPGQQPGRAGLQKLVQELLDAYPQINIKIDEMIASADKVITR